MTRANAVFNSEIWTLLSLYSSGERWGMYGEWGQLHTRFPDSEFRVRHVEVTRDIRSILRRVTISSSDDKSSRSSASTGLAIPLSKLAHSNPCIVVAECVKQSMAYDNLHEAIGESARLFTPLAYDVLLYEILAAFSNSNKPRMKEDGTSVSLWLQSRSYHFSLWKSH